MKNNVLWLALVLGTAASVGADFPVNHQANDQCNPFLTFGGGQYLAAWMDDLIAPCRIRAARITSSGQVLDTSGISFPSQTPSEAYPQAAFSGASYLVVWQKGKC